LWLSDLYSCESSRFIAQGFSLGHFLATYSAHLPDFGTRKAF
jgi:hypothetical protein